MGFHTFQGHYPALSDVPSQGYDDDDLARKIAPLWLQKVRNSRQRTKVADTTGHLVLPLILSEYLDKPVTILDFGGGAGAGLSAIMAHVPGIDPKHFSYIVVETPAMVRAIGDELLAIAQRRIGHEVTVKVLDAIPSSVSGNLIVNVAGTIQYIDAWKETLAKLAALAPSTFIVSQTPVTDGKTYARQQLNMPNKRLASWVFNRFDFLDAMKALGYAPVFTVDHDLDLTHRNAPGPSNMATMIFKPYHSTFSKP